MPVDMELTKYWCSCDSRTEVWFCRLGRSGPLSAFTNCRVKQKRAPAREPFSQSIQMDHFIVGMENSAPSLMPDGQRLVTVLVRVQNLIESMPCWLRSPKAEAFQPPKEW